MMKRPYQNSAPIDVLGAYPVKSGGYSFIGRLLTVLIPTVIFLVLIFATQIAGAAFPTVVGSSNSEQASNNPPTITLPANIVAGDLVIVFLAQDETATATWPSPWVELVDENAGTAANLHVAYLIASGGETTVAPTMSADERSQHLAIRISAASWDGITPPEVSTPLTGASGTPDSGSLTPSWGSEDTLWITTFGMDGPDVRFPVTVWPTNYADNNLSNGTGDLSTAGIALATRNLATATEDPGAFTTTGSDDWVASTIAVRPVGPPTYSTAVSSVDPGWQNNRKHAVFYNGSRFFLLYSKGDGSIYYKSSPDNVDWSSPGESTLAGITGANTGLFDIYLVNDAKFDLVYWRSTNQNRYVNTCTISGATITCGASPVGINGTISKVAVARSGAGNRIYVVATNGSDLWVAAANNTGDAANVTAFPNEVTLSSVDPTAVAIVPYQGADEVLVVYTKNLGGSGSDGVYSRVITSGGGAGTEEEVNASFDSLPDFSSPVRISDTDFRIIVKPPGATLQEYQWNDTSWSSVETVDTETDQETPSLFYDRISGDMYAFSVDTSLDDVERHYKPNGGSWQAEEVADDGEATAHSYPITQVHEPPPLSVRVAPRELVWAYRVVNGADYDLKVGNLNIAQANRCWSSELLTNPGFETGDATGWTNDGGGGAVDIGLKCSWCDDLPFTGSYQAYWETDSEPTYYLYQTVDLSSYASDIDAGNAVITATGWLISNEYQASPPYDEFYMQVRFYDVGSSEIVPDRYDTGTVNNANWAQYGIVNYTIPTGARSVEVRFSTWEACCDAGSADDFSVTVGTPCAAGQYDQDSFRTRNDNGDETTSTWTAAADTDWNQMVDKNFRVRFLVQETAGVADSGKTFQLEYNRNGGGWNDVTGSSSVVKAAATANVTDAVDTTQQLGSGTYVSTNGGFDESNGQVGSMDFAGSDEVELELSLQIVSADVSNGDTIQLRGGDFPVQKVD
jgi:hypothetical protein